MNSNMFYILSVLLVASAAYSDSAVAASALCAGGSPDSAFLFHIGEENTVDLLAISGDLTPGISYSPEKEEVVEIIGKRSEKSLDSLSFHFWEGNYGWEIEIPSVAFDPDNATQHFDIDYHYRYDDQVQEEVSVKLACHLL